ncbi:hypothetical protein AYI69_g8185 [Smittium culicis]|uniref:Uncharacterized protein n=1 Tax=Smittium culicis TaxID=133412 RepID=A0A1R1XLF1_9FUNG|nr:hypothetical protein AYI69_g8185 [Smittium culicis]
MVLPIRLPQFLYNLKNDKFPKYFLYALLAASSEIISENLQLKSVHIDKVYADAAMKLLREEKNLHDPHVVWACVLMTAYHWKHPDIRSMEYLLSKL